MVPEGALKCSRDQQGAAELLAQYPDFDMIPIRKGEAFAAYLERGETNPRPIQVDDLVSDATSIIELVEILSGRPRAFVLVRDRIRGYVHFSDLNHPIVKLPLFVLMEAVERRFFESIAARVTDDLLERVLDPARCKALKDKMRRLTESRANLNWAAQLGFWELLMCARELGVMRAEASDIDCLSRVRNLVCHAATDLLVEEHAHVRRLALAKKIAFELLKAPRVDNR